MTEESTTYLGRNRTPLMIAVVASVSGLILLALFAYLLFGSGDEDVGEATPTPFAAPIFLTPQDIISVQLGGASPITLTLDTPTFLTVGGQQFAIQAQPVAPDGAWAPAFTQENMAAWLQGSVINYVFGLDDTTNNRNLIQSLTPGADLTLQTKQGTIYQFAFESRTTESVQNTDVFSQRQPGITLVLVGTQGPDRLVARGAFQSPETLGSGLNPAPFFSLGETADLGGLQLTVTGATHLLDRPEAPAGFVFYLVDVQAHNASSDGLDLSSLVRLTLGDDLGNQYAVSPAAGQLGNFPPLPTLLGPGETAQGTVGYQIPAGLQTAQLTWTARREDSGQTVEVRIPFAAESGDAAAAQVDLLSAEITLDGTSLMLQGQISNSNQQALVVRETDVTLTSQGAVFLILSTNPGFPWIVNAGQTLPFSVAFQRPQTPAPAVFTVLNHSFEISGLP